MPVRATLGIPTSILSKCTEAEREDLGHWWAETLKGRREAELRDAPYSVYGYAVPKVLEAIKAGVVQTEEAAKLWAAIDLVSGALRKSGLKRPARAARPARGEKASKQGTAPARVH
jgi:hypothetical protein